MTDFSLALFGALRDPVITPEHIERWGAPARALPYSGMPSAESESRMLKVMENLIVTQPSATHPPLILPVSYRMTCLRSPDGGLVALHDNEDAVWSWRPLLYNLNAFTDQQLGSQNELEYRVGLAEASGQTADVQDRLTALSVALIAEEKAVRQGRLRKNARKRMMREYRELAMKIIAEPRPEMTFVEARDRADAILWECLSGQQRLDLLARNGFYVAGRLNRLYEIRVGNGYAIVHPDTRDELVSICLHPEAWMPYADIALATKLGIEASEETEAELLEASNARPVHGRTQATERELVASRLEARFLTV